MSESTTDFEGEIRKSLLAYSEAGIASLDFLPVSTAPYTKSRSDAGQPLRVVAGKNPFDIFGWMLDGAKFVACELRLSRSREERLSIVAPEENGMGLHFTQLDALAHAAMAGGLAHVVWSNGGELGVLDGPQIILAHTIYLPNLAAVKQNQPTGSKSIRWERFKPVEYDTVGIRVVPNWLTSPRSPSAQAR